MVPLTCLFLPSQSSESLLIDRWMTVDNLNTFPCQRYVTCARIHSGDASFVFDLHAQMFFWSPNTLTYRSITQFSNHQLTLVFLSQVIRDYQKTNFGQQGNNCNSKTAMLALCDANEVEGKSNDSSMGNVPPQRCFYRDITSTQIAIINSDQCKDWSISQWSCPH